jgi:ATP-binding cassette subfamily G (WHITE) protein 2 (PDR)
MRDVIMTMLGLSHTVNTKVGNDYIRGVSGGERKRVSIAEAALGGSPIQCWDNSTRGLDSATALEFVKNLRISTNLTGSTAIVAIYQASQAIYDVRLIPFIFFFIFLIDIWVCDEFQGNIYFK